MISSCSFSFFLGSSNLISFHTVKKGSLRKSYCESFCESEDADFFCKKLTGEKD